MNPFTPNETNIPSAPLEIPTPDIPRADFHSVGRQVAEGAKESGWLDGLWKLLVDWIPDILGAIVGGLLGLIEVIIAYILRLFSKVRAGGEFGANEIAAAAVKDLFGVDVKGSIFSGGGGSADREQLASNVASAIFGALGLGAETHAGGTLAPSRVAADKLITTVTHLAIEGWYEGFLMELVSAGQVETFAELKDIFAQALGLGRLTRAAFRPASQILMEQPFRQLLNQTYHPTALSEGVLVRQYLRGKLDRSALGAEMDLLGYSSARVDELVNYHSTHLPAGDIIDGLRTHFMSDDLAKALLHDQGHDSAEAQLLIDINTQKRRNEVQFRLATEGLQAYADGKLDLAGLRQFVNDALLDDEQKFYLNESIPMKTLVKRKRITLAEAQKLVELGIWDLDQFRNLLEVEGYTVEDARDLELLLLGKIKDQADAAAKRAALEKQRAEAAAKRTAAAIAKADAAKAAAEAHGLSLAKFETLVLDGLKTMAEYGAFLADKQIAPDNAAALQAALQVKLDAAAKAHAATPAAAAKAKARNLSLAQLEQALKAGLISQEEYLLRLKESGISDADAALLLGVITQQKADSATRAKALAEAKAAAAVKHIDLSQAQHAVRLGLSTLDAYKAFLVGHGFADEDVVLLVAELAAQVAQDDSARKAKAAAKAKTPAKALSLAKLEQAVRAGVESIDAYHAELTAQGYDQASQDALVSLLQLQLDQDKATLAAQGRAAALPGERVLSLAELARAAVLGVVPVSVYTDALAAAGVSPDDAQILTMSLAARIQATRKTQSVTKTAAKTVAAAGLSLTGLERDVLDGRLSIEQLGGQLAGAGVDPQAVDAIVSLVQEELANQASIKALLVDAGNRAAAKALNLAQETAAVHAGVKTLADYAAFVAELGYDAADQATLVSTLQAALAPKTGKTPPKGPAVVPGP